MKVIHWKFKKSGREEEMGVLTEEEKILRLNEALLKRKLSLRKKPSVSRS